MGKQQASICAKQSLMYQVMYQFHMRGLVARTPAKSSEP